MYYQYTTKRYLSSVIFLLSGLGTSVFIYLTSEDISVNVLGFELEDSKKYLHELELYGGKANVLAVEFTNWFNGLWHGKSLAYTIGCITILISFLLFFADYHAPSGLGPNDHEKKKPDGTN